MEYTNIKLEKENRVATIRLNRPDALNALNPELLDEISSGVTEAGRDESIKALVIRGEGRAFCAGADLTYFQTTLEDRALLPGFVAQINGTMRKIEELPFPAIAVVHGFALAGGLELMMACDMALVADDEVAFLPPLTNLSQTSQKLAVQMAGNTCDKIRHGPLAKRNPQP